MREFKIGDKILVDGFDFPATIAYINMYACTVQVDDKEEIGWSGDGHDGLLPEKRYWYIGVNDISGRASKLLNNIKD